MTTRKDLRSGYSSGLVALVNASDQSLLCVRFAQHCIKNDISASAVAEMFNVTRTAVYAWFKGEYEPSFAHRERMHDMLGDPRPV